MKLWKKITFALLGLIVVSQLPFIYRRHQLALLRESIAKLNSQRKVDRESTRFADFKGVIHVHSMLGGHSNGSFQDIIRAAGKNRLDFVIMTEHPSAEMDTAAMTLKGLQGGVLFINGNETVTADGDRLLLVPGVGWANDAGKLSTQGVIARATADKCLAFVAYPQEFKNWNAEAYSGIEVYNLYTNARRAHALPLFFDGLWSYRSFPDLLFARFYERPDESLKMWDTLLAGRDGRRRLIAIAGNDAHANMGFGLSDGAGKQLFGIKLDPYERSFAVVRNHVLMERNQTLSADSLLAALAAGHSYLAFDLFCDATGFSFTASGPTGQAMMGDEIKMEQGLRLSVKTPVRSRIELIRDGALLEQKSADETMDFPITQNGVYRVEAYLDQLPEPLRDKPWIISNPIYVR